ncbi:MAG TPA: DNA-protecting protein DprA [candidate division WOR-3 bacterium]|uniref:DNA-protecting protein DprA n=1 Tax=candidate division WOR-3 bacterium TaxID=2052148 RepID=A0A7V0T6V3_UNCW3|nr:DNA-protecting protein DprA [candidate division WOR-3 bacterium]
MPALNKLHADLAAIPRLTATRLRNLLERFKTAEAVLGARAQDLAEVEGVDVELAGAIAGYRRTPELGARIDRAREAGVWSADWRDAAYPAALRELRGMPTLLFGRGELCDDDRLAVAVVGTRRPSAYGQQVAERLARDFVGHGVTVVSGLARGIDTCAHRAAIAGGGRTIAVLGSGVDVPYPPENERLLGEVADHGAVLSEFGLGAEPMSTNFPRRNRIVSALSRAVIAVEAGERSGVLNTVAWAADQGRDVYAVPGRITDQSSAGINRLLREGARPVLGAEDVLCDLGVALHFEERQKLPLEEEEKNVIALLSGDPQHVDEIAQMTELAMARLLGVLMQLEVKGAVRQLPGKFFIRCY